MAILSQGRRPFSPTVLHLILVPVFLALGRCLLTYCLLRAPGNQTFLFIEVFRAYLISKMSSLCIYNNLQLIRKRSIVDYVFRTQQLDIYRGQFSEPGHRK